MNISSSLALSLSHSLSFYPSISICISVSLCLSLALSTCRIAGQDTRDAFGIIVSYAVKVKLFLGALGGELCAELPFILMHPKVCNY